MKCGRGVCDRAKLHGNTDSLFDEAERQRVNGGDDDGDDNDANAMPK